MGVRVKGLMLDSELRLLKWPLNMSVFLIIYDLHLLATISAIRVLGNRMTLKTLNLNRRICGGKLFSAPSAFMFSGQS